MMRCAIVAISALLVGACAADLTSPFAAVAATYDSGKHQYKLAQVTVTTLSTSLRHLRGTAGQVRAGGVVKVISANLVARGATVRSLRDTFVRSGPQDVNLAWSILNDIVYPENFDSLELLSGYYNLEKARKTFAEYGLTDLPAMPIVAHAQLLDERGLSPIPAGELYYPPLATFYFPVSATPDGQLPLVFNLGAMAHALGHEAVSELAWGGTPVPAPELGPHDAASNSSRHVSLSLAEGIADYLGVAVSQDPRWFDHSEQQRAATRALDTLRCSSPDMLQALPVDDEQVPYDPVPLGTVLAGALWESSQAGVQISAKGVFAALPDIGRKPQAGGGQLTVALVLDVLVARAADERKPDLCGLFLNRFAQLSITSLPSCSGVTVAPHAECQ